MLIGLVSLLCYVLATVMLLYVPYLLSVPLVVPLVVVLGICLFPGFKQLLVQYQVFPFLKQYVIDPYYAEHPKEDVDERKNIGV